MGFMLKHSNNALKYVRVAHRTSVTPHLLWAALRALFPQKPLRHTGRLTRRWAVS